MQSELKLMKEKYINELNEKNKKIKFLEDIISQNEETILNLRKKLYRFEKGDFEINRDRELKRKELQLNFDELENLENTFNEKMRIFESQKKVNIFNFNQYFLLFFRF